ncbi:MAG: tRNA (N6-isopentenyl adenosine(37)-C2)-methylthiotransferase MiaB [candidate division Zixibacteria bacterium]|nr:tRNA (N6-isopentenyl adenosine(37)-C2)-methylthiotransferase MiaB [candidate division Zixibacteria bacterium]
MNNKNLVKKKVFLKTFGCQMNVYDSEVLKGILSKNGYSITDRPEEAELLIVNTCSVREHAEVRAIGRLNELSRYKLENPEVKLAVIGCMAQRLGERFLKEVPALDFILGTEELFKLPDYLEKKKDERPLVALSFSELKEIGALPQRKTKFSAFVAISRGCDNFCSYCIVPYVRGPEKNRKVSGIIKEIQCLAESGCKEVSLIGQNVNSYKDDGFDFADLLREVSETDIQRIRFMTSHPKDLSPKLIEAMSNLEKVCEHLHLPLQSGSDKILEKMNRKYNLNDYLRLVDSAKSKVENLSLTTDLIVGFPGEKDEDFQKTLEMIEKIEFDSAFMFKYSPREGTKAFLLEDDVPKNVKLERLQTLIEIQKNISWKKNQRLIDTTEEVLIDGKSKRDKLKWKGKGRSNKMVIIPKGKKDENLLGEIVIIKITDVDSFTLFGKIEGSVGSPDPTDG